jgi:hypothetical protein
MAESGRHQIDKLLFTHSLAQKIKIGWLGGGKMGLPVEVIRKNQLVFFSMMRRFHRYCSECNAVLVR